MKIAVLLLSLLAVAAARRASRIHHGSVVSQKEVESLYPFVVGIMACGNDRRCSACTGSLVKSDTILAAAHCFCKFDYINVYFKTTSVQRGTMIPARSMQMNPNYRCGGNNHFQNDIATLKLSKPKTDITPIKLECRNEKVGEPITIIGYGRDERGNSGTLKVGHQKVGVCPKQQGPVICSDGNNRKQDLIDHGDSGGPMLVRSGRTFKQLGIQVGQTTWTMRSRRGTSSNTVQIFNRVSPYCQWILK